ncbi:MAG: glycine betaine/L-proline ABC transporter substrate-binding protein ProX [Cyanobacteria bacterium P01_F01_bin.86]
MKQISALLILGALLAGLNACQTPSETAVDVNNPEASDAATPGQGITVRPGTGPVFFGRFVAEILAIGLEELGYTTQDVKTLNPSVMHVAIGDGELDFSSIHLRISHAPLFEKGGGEEKLARIGQVIPQLVEGYQIDKKTAEEYDITTIAQLQDPEIAALFDSDGDGKANLAGCDVGRACERTIDTHLESYELTNTVEHDKGKNEVLMANTIARYKQGEPVIYYNSNPSAVDFELLPGEDTIWLEVPFTPSSDQQVLTEDDTTVDGKNLGFAVNQVQVVANREFIASNPAAERWFEQVLIPIEDIIAQSELLQQGENQPADIRRHAEEWVQNNREQFDGWLAEARAAVN